jgi:hypothetical protein
LTITLLMAVATAVVTYFVDLAPSVNSSGTRVASNASIGAPVLD